MSPPSKSFFGRSTGGVALSWSCLLLAHVLLMHGPVAADTVTVGLADTSTTAGLRWMDIADNEYGTSFQSTFNYAAATVVVSYDNHSTAFSCTVSATGLKPNFAYQIKIDGTPGGRTDNEWLGLAGRWWQEQWDGSSWSNGQNLNIQPDANPRFYYPNPNQNDLIYYARRDVPSSSSPSGYLYRFTGYLVLGYFVTDAQGNATVDIEEGNSCHVLWKTSQRIHNGAYDGPLVSTTLSRDISFPAYAYDTVSPPRRITETIQTFGEWEHLPRDGIALPEGDYSSKLVLTEESFHATDPLGGTWARAMECPLDFTLVPPPLSTVRTFSASRYTAGSTLDVTLLMSHTDPGVVSALAFSESLPPGWTFDRVITAPCPMSTPAAGASGALNFSCLTMPTTWPLEFAYRVAIPAGTHGVKGFSGTATFWGGGSEVSVQSPSTRIDADVHVVSFVSGGDGSIAGMAHQYVPHGGTTATVAALPAFGCLFDDWDDGSPGALRAYGPVLGDATLTARFQPAAQVPPGGSFMAMVDASNAASGRGIWDLSGPVETVLDGQPLTLDMVHDSKGKIRGMGTYMLAGSGAVPVAVTGSSTSRAGVLTVKLNVTGGLGADSFSCRMALTLNATSGNLEGVTVFRGRIAGLRIAHTDTTMVMAPPGGMDGTWDLVFNLVVDSGNRVTGDALLTLANGEEFLFATKGRVKNQITVLDLKADPTDLAARPIRIKTSIQPLETEQARLLGLKAKAFGQHVAW